MGICNSCEATAVASAATAKLVTEDGKLQEFSWPVKASKVLQKQQQHNSFFICSADDMEFDSFVTAVDLDDELQLGQLYFVLPVSMRRRPLDSEDMAALAVKASAALVASAGGCGCDKRSKAPALVFPTIERVVDSRRSGGRSGRRRQRFAAELGAIPE